MENRVSHPEQLAFLSAVIAANPAVIERGRVLEVGSYDVNGSVRGLFENTGQESYVGVDLVEGPGVDRVQYGHEVDDPDGSFDVTVSAECFEHDENWQKTFANMVRLTRPGGVVTFTCASLGRVEHGTRRTLVTDSPGTQAEGMDYYRNLTAEDFTSAFDLAGSFAEWRFAGCTTTFDLYFAGVRGGAAETCGRLPADADVRAIRSMMPLPGRAVRWPLRVMRAVTPGETAYQRVAVPYWLAMIRLARRLGVTGVASH
jgi:SAM-dependent methyltransferase